MKRLLIAALALALAWSDFVGAEEEQSPAEELQSRIDQINTQIEEENGSLALLDGRASDLEAQLKVLRTDSERLKAEERELSQSLSKIDSERKELEEEIGDLDAQAMSRRDLSMKRIRASYMHPTEQALSDLFRDSRSESFSHLGFYLAAVRSYDRRMVDELVELKRSRAEKVQELQSVLQNQHKVVQDLKVKREGIARKMAAQEPLMKQLKAQHVEQEKVITQLRAQLLRFETVLVGLTGGGAERRTTIQPHSPEQDQPAQDSTPFDGRGLSGMKGQLDPPVQGKILVPFGREISAANGIAGSSKGVEIAAPVDSVVTAVAQGKVIFYGRMPVLGTIVILDHGDRYYSLYGRLAAVAITRDAVIAPGAVIGKVSEPEPDGRNFYFEIRKNGTPINPSVFLSRKI